MHNIIERERERERNLYLIRFQRRILFNLHAAKKRDEEHLFRSDLCEGKRIQ